ncbi:glycosyltransferase [uncultured Friedmanniella sp.]|uniref:glycosyltransferase n=1 Tax=uncultured Friedmanniella sp. TaxID=335381 RepID=UPI0035CA0E5D
MRVLITSHPGLGHVNGLAALARRLRRHGHPVLAAGAPSAVEAFRLAGIDGRVIVPEPLGSEAVLTARPPGTDVAGRDRRGVVESEVCLKRRARALLEPLSELVEQWRPDVVLRDATESAAWLVSERLRVPHASFEVSTHWSEERWSAEVGPQLEALRSLAGVRPHPPTSGMYRYLHLNNSPRALLEPGTSLPPTSMDLAPGFFDDYRPGALVQPPAGFVYLAFSTVYTAPAEVVRAVVLILAREHPGVVVTGGGVDPGDRVWAPDFVSQSALMPGCAAVVCHGGRNTVLTAAAHGVPVVCAPIASDHFDMADAVERAGIGRSTGWEAEEIAAAVSAVVGSTEVRRRSAELLRQIQAMPTLDDAVGTLERTAAAGAISV